MPRLAHPPYINALVAALKSYVRTAGEHVPNEEVWEELRETKRGKERGRRESSYAKAVVGSIAWLLWEVAEDQVTSKRDVVRLTLSNKLRWVRLTENPFSRLQEVHQASLIRLIVGLPFLRALFTSLYRR